MSVPSTPVNWDEHRLYIGRKKPLRDGDKFIAKKHIKRIDRFSLQDVYHPLPNKSTSYKDKNLIRDAKKGEKRERRQHS